jgi:hypothetical protein
VRDKGGFRILSKPLAGEFPGSAENGEAKVKKNKMRAPIAFVLCFLAGLFAVSGCGTGPSRESGQREEQPKIRIGARTAIARYDLGHDEARGGHTLARHVARTDGELRERLARERNISAAL